MAEWSAASDERRTTEQRDSEMQERSRSPIVCLTDRGESGHTASTLQSVRREVCDGDIDVSLFPPPFAWMVAGDLFSLFRRCFLMIQVVRWHRVFLPMKVNWLRTHVRQLSLSDTN